MTKYLKKAAIRLGTPKQSEPLDERQVPNSAGGFAYPVTDWVQLDRFLVLGSEGGSYYAKEQELTMANTKAVSRCIVSDGVRVVKTVVEVSSSGRAPKNDPALFVLAMCAASKDKKTRAEAYAAIPKVARIGTHLFHFGEYVNSLRGWSRGLRTAVSNWYLDQDLVDLESQLVKYQSRDGWSHRDMLRLSHPDTEESSVRNAALRWAVTGLSGMMAREEKRSKGVGLWMKKYPDVMEHLEKLPLIAAFEEAKTFTLKSEELKDKSDEEKKELVRKHVRGYEKEIVSLIEKSNLTREMIPTEFQNSKLVWEALFQKMPMTAMIRNLANMTRAGVLAPMSEVAKEVKNRLANQEALKKARVHPIQLLMALKTYQAGHGVRSRGEGWTPVSTVVDALDEAFYLSFGNVEQTGKRWYIGLDISGSMNSGEVAGVIGLTPRVASSALAMVTARVEDEYVIRAFSDGETGRKYHKKSTRTMHPGFDVAMVPLEISPRERLDDVCKKTDGLPFGGTDCALPMLDALEDKL